MNFLNPRSPSNMSHDFSKVPNVNIPRSSFKRDHKYTTDFDAGKLIPVFFDIAFPGDTMNVKGNFFGRLKTPIVPFMDNLYLDVQYWSVPIRQIWDNFQKFMGEQENPGDSTDYLIPQAISPAGGYLRGTLGDYFGLPTFGQVSGTNTVPHSSLFQRAYIRIWNQWYRDESYCAAMVEDKGDGPDGGTLYSTVLPRLKRYDYFTSCLPWPQKGPAVTIPSLTQNLPVFPGKLTSTGLFDGWDTKDASSSFLRIRNASPITVDFATRNGALDTNYRSTDAYPASTWPSTNPLLLGLRTDDSRSRLDSGEQALFAEYDSDYFGTINDLRLASAVQQVLERDARGGTRYKEMIYSHFGVLSDDARLMRPEFLGSNSSPININPIPQTSATDTTSPQGNLAANGTVISSAGFVKSFTEHCIVLGLASIRADLNYQQGLDRMFSYRSRFDFYLPSFAHLGEQAVLRKEIYCDGTENDYDVFGYNERWSEMRYKKSLITGQLRSTDAQSLDIWHLAQEFSAAPVLDVNFIIENPPIDRVSAVTNEPAFIFNAYYQYNHVRALPAYSVPGMMGRF